MQSFRVTNYRCVDDSGESHVGRIKALVGKNESGKTTILKALHKFNPASPEAFNGLREFPRRRFHDYDDGARVVEVKFSLLPEEKKILSDLDARLTEVSGVSVTKDYAGNYTVNLLPEVPISAPNWKGLSPLLAELQGAIQSISDSSPGPEFDTRSKLLESFGRIGTGVDHSADLVSSPSHGALVGQIQETLNLLGQGDEKESYRKIRATIQLILNTVKWPTIMSQVQNFVVSKLPVFIYFENYAIVDSRIHLPSFVERLTSGALTAEEKTARTLFSLVNLEPERLVELGKKQGKNPQQIQEGIDERALRVDRASLSLTGTLADLWQQRKNRIDFDIDGEHLRLWVTDNVDGSKIELEQRSKGFQWFLSFYVVFMVESEEGHKDAVLLLDEPGLHLHASAQEDLLGVIGKLSERNQIIYTTHSPFMVDMEALDTISTVVESKEKGTKVSDTVWATDRDALFPLQAALGYSLSQALFMGQYNLVVEGITDFWIISTISQHFRDSGRGYIDDGIVISPAGGAQKSALMAAMLSGQKLKVAVLLDSDVEGRTVRNDLVKSRIIKENNVLFVSDASQEPGREMDLEDLLPVDLYLRLANETHTKELGKNLLTDSVIIKGVPIRRSLEAEFDRRGTRFSKFKVARHFMNEFPKVPLASLAADFVTNMEHLFALANKVKPIAQPLVTVAPDQ